MSHDPYYELSRDYIEYTETSESTASHKKYAMMTYQNILALYNLWKQTLNPTSPLYAAIGNHDSYQQAFDPPLPFPINLGNNRVGTMSILHDCGKARDGLMGKLLKRLRRKLCSAKSFIVEIYAHTYLTATMALTLFNMRQTSRSLPSTLISGTAPTSLLTSTLLILITLASSNF